MQKNQYLKQKIQKIIKDRKQHNQIINNLLNKDSISTLKSSSVRNHSDMNIETYRSNISRCSDISKQVNLLAYLHSNAKQEFHDQFHEEQQSTQLKKQICERFGENITIHLCPDSSIETGILASQQSIDFEIIVNFFNENDLWEQIFVQQNNNYYLKMYGFSLTSNKKYCLSERNLLSQQIQLISDNGEGEVFIGYLLLYRVLSLFLKTGFAPQIFQYILGHPYKIYQIQSTKSYLSLLNALSQSTNDKLLLGCKLSNNQLEEIPEQNQTKNQIQNYPNVYKELSSKQLALAHRRNHHIVIDFDATFSGEYFFTMVCNSSKKNRDKVRYRLCIMDENLKLVHYQLARNQEYSSIFLQKSEYKIYLSEINQTEESQFTFVIQSKNSLQQSQLHLKFVEEYKTFSRTIVNQYLQSISLDQIQKQMIHQREVNCQSDFIILRVSLNFLDFHVDFISMNSAKDISNFLIEYTEKQCLCDLEYKSNVKKLYAHNITLFQVYLSKQTQIKCINGMSYTFSKLRL